ncbi:MAG: outer membrane protein assembly factor BamD [Spirochaetaceae bacterium]|nr:MAG: outer membrane protein assembly factor BamD [Spirochaetaceae bacterium]
MYRRFYMSLAALFLVAGTALLGASGRDLFEEAERRFASGNYSLAIERYERLLSDFPGTEFTPRAHFRIAQSNYYLQNYDAALDRFQRAAVRAPGGGLARQIRFWTGMTTFQLQRYQESAAAFDRYLADQPEQRGRAHLYRGLARLEMGDTAGSREDLERALPLLEGSEQGFATALLLEVYARTDESQAILGLWESLGPDMDRDDGYHEQRLRYVADAAYERNETSLARTLYLELVEYSLSSAQWGYQRLYAIAREEGDREQMQEIFRLAERRLAGEPRRMTDFWYSLGVEAVVAGRYELAELHLFRVWDVRTERRVPGTVPHMLARAIERQGRPLEAADILLVSLEDPNVDVDVQVERRLAAARIFLREGRYSDALDIVSAMPERTRASSVLYAWTYSLYRLGRTGEALEILDRNALQPLVRERPDLARLRGRLQLDGGRPADAVRSYRDYLADRPEDMVARVELVRALVGAEQFAAADQEARRIAAEELPDALRDELAYLRGLTSFHDARFAEAERFLTGVRDGRYEPLRSYHLAWSRYRQGDTENARDTISAVLEVLPESLLFDGGYLYSWTLFRTGRRQESIRQLLRLLGASLERSRELQVRQLLATVYLEEEQVDEALLQYQRLVSLADDDQRRALLWNQYAATLAAVGRPAEAVDQFDELHAALPGTTAGREALLESGQVLYSTGVFAEARDRYRTYQNRYPEGPDLDRALYWAGVTSLELGEAARALLWWEPLIREFPRSTYTPRALIGTAGIYADRGQQRQALELYDRFVAAYPDDARAAEADRERRRIRLELDGLSTREAELWVELEPAGRPGPEKGGDRWFGLVLELGRIAIREQITLTTQRNRIVEYLIEGSRLEGDESARASVLLAEYYRRRGETRAALESYVRAASAPGVSDELAAQSLYEMAVLAREQGERTTMEQAARELSERFGDSVWADRARRLLEQN